MTDKEKSKITVQESAKTKKKAVKKKPLKLENIHQALARIQKDLKAPKGQFNKFGNFSYRSCEDILEAVKPLLNGLYLRTSDKVVMIGDRHYIKATAKLSDGKESIENPAYAREPLAKKGMDEAQITGATSSYARKYALNGLFAIDDTKDADTEKPAVAEVKPKKILNDTDVKAISGTLQDIVNARSQKTLALIAAKIKAGKKIEKYNEAQVKVLKEAYITKLKKLSFDK